VTRSFTLAVLLPLIGLLSAQPSTEAAGQDGSGWMTLINGSTLDGWNVVGEGTWTLVDGAIEGDGEAGFLVTADSYSDFQLTLEFWVGEDSNSGVFFRCSDPNDIGSDTSYEVNIADTHENKDFRSGAIVGVVAPSQTVVTAEKWNTYNITARGEKLTVILNGIITADPEDGQYASGPIALQHLSGVVKFRNLLIRKL
jgi:hypothetical protein